MIIFMGRKTQYLEDISSPQIITIFNLIPIKISSWILKIYGKAKGKNSQDYPQELTDIMTYNKATII